MPRPTYLDYDPIARDADGIAESQSTATAGTVTLNGAQADLGTAARWDIGDSYPTSIAGAKLRIASASEGVTYTFTGKNEYGTAITEAVVGAAGSPATDTVQYFSQVTAITTSGQADLIVIGAGHSTVSRPIPLNWRNREPATYALYDLNTTAGDVSAVITEYFGDFQTDGFATDGWATHVTTATEGAIAASLHARAVRVSMATNGADFQFAVLQN